LAGKFAFPVARGNWHWFCNRVWRVRVLNLASAGRVMDVDES
jgi:hypothetical protein